MGFLNKINSLVRKKLGLTIVRGDLFSEVRQVQAANLEAKHLLNCKVYPDRYSILKDLPKGGQIAEIGVAYGDFSKEQIKELQPEKFTAIDFFDAIKIGNEPDWGNNRLDKTSNSHEEYYLSIIKQYTEDEIEIKKGKSWEKISEFKEKSLDYAYIDAGHTYKDISKDVHAIKNKIAIGGHIQFNDYTCISPTELIAYGVQKAVNNLLLEGNYKMIAFCLQNIGFHDVVLKRIS